MVAWGSVGVPKEFPCAPVGISVALRPFQRARTLYGQHWFGRYSNEPAFLHESLRPGGRASSRTLTSELPMPMPPENKKGRQPDGLA